jgi:hypothetical protein
MPSGRSFGWPHPFVVRPWDELADRYSDLAQRVPAFGVMVDVVESVRSSGVADRLAATTSMHDLLVVDRPVPEPPMEVLVVSAPGSVRPASGDLVRVQHLSHTGRNDVVDRSPDEVVALFWRFILEKFGITPTSGRP